MALPKNIEENVLKEARSWIGTRWNHCQSDKESQVDCIGFLKSVAIATGFDIELPPKVYNPTPHGEEMFDYLNRNFIKKKFINDISIIENCDVLVFKYFNLPHHLGIASTGLGNVKYVIHASTDVMKVTEHILDGKLLKKLIAVYSLDPNRYIKND